MRITIKKLHIKKISLTSLVSSLLVLYTIFATDSLVIKTNISPIPWIVSRIIICLITVVGFIFIKHTRQKFSYLVCFVGAACLSIMFSHDFTGGYIFQIILFAYGYFISQIISFEDFKKHYIFWMRIIALVSIIGIIFHNQIINTTFIPTLENSVNVKSKFLFFTNVSYSTNKLTGNFSLIRNWGPFWEPGCYQIYLILALIFSLFGNRHINVFDMIIFSLAAVTTFSAAAFVVLALLYFIFFFFYNSHYSDNFHKIRKYIFIIVILSIYIVLILPGVASMLVGKLFDINGPSAQSSQARYYSIFFNIYAMLLHPFGSGPNFLDSEINSFKTIFNLVNLRNDFGNVNSFLLFFSAFGILFGVLYSFGLKAFCNKIYKNKFISFWLFIIIMLEMFNEPLTYSLIFHVIVMYGNVCIFPKKIILFEHNKNV